MSPAPQASEPRAETAGLILVVDDHADTRQMLRVALSGAALSPILAENGSQALALLDQIVPDLILLDAVMPEIDGFATCRQIKSRPDCAHVPVIFMTGLVATEHVVQGLQAGGVDYVTKPLVIDELLARIEVHLANARISQRALSALDAIGRKLIASDAQGAILWTTAPAAKLLALTDADAVQAQIMRMIGSVQRGQSPQTAQVVGQGRIQIGYIGRVGAGEFLFRLRDSIDGREASLLQDSLGLTPRESEVLHWISMGKSNKDTSEILNISARTVNKHLEQIFIKLGVENRSAAASIATRLISMTD
jgi:DNA-binding response OmpR family regulator/DNA-binding CsgD family transcriptional regulator